jgi:glutathione S-transferase
MGLTLVVGNKNYSSWSLRPWLAMRQAGLAFDEIVIPLYQQGSKAALLRHSPAGRVPVLMHDGRAVWESLAIMEYLAETFPARGFGRRVRENVRWHARSRPRCMPALPPCAPACR